MKKILALFLVTVLMAAFYVPMSASGAGLYGYEFLEDGTICLTEYNRFDETVLLPSEIDGYTVSALGDCLFLRNIYIRKVVIPGTVKTIGRAAFQESCIEQVILPEGLQTIGERAFFGCYELNKLVIPPSVEEIGYHALGFGYYQDPAEPDLIPGSVGVREEFVLIGDNSPTAKTYAEESNVAFRDINSFGKGDADFNDILNTADARFLLRYVLEGYIHVWTVADMNDNGIADTTDVRLILSPERYLF